MCSLLAVDDAPDPPGTCGLVIRLVIEQTEPLTGVAEAAGISPCEPFVSWLEMLRAISNLVAADGRPVGAAAFAVAAVLAAFSTSAEMLIAPRAILGVAGATLMPSTMSLIRTMFHNPAQRTVAIGMWISSFSVGAAIGPLVGGLLLE